MLRIKKTQPDETDRSKRLGVAVKGTMEKIMSYKINAKHRALLARAVRELKDNGKIGDDLVEFLTQKYPDTTVENEPLSQPTRKMMNDTNLETKRDKIESRRQKRQQQH